MQEGMGWIVDADVRGYCDSLARTRLREALRHSGHDGRRLRLRGPWLWAVGMEAGVLPPRTQASGKVVPCPPGWPISFALRSSRDGVSTRDSPA
jgi:hypothetical protein